MGEEKRTFEIAEVPAQRVAYIRYKGRYDEVGDYLKKLFRSIGGNAAGKPFALYYDETFKAEDAEIEVCVPVKKAVEKGEVSSRVLEAGEHLITTHIGAYDTITQTYEAMKAEIARRQIRTSVPIREVYEKGPGMIFKGDPDSYRTVIMFPVIK